MNFLSYLINGISLGSVYAIIALGYTMVYGIAKMLNFAHGDVIMVGCYIVFMTMSGQGWGAVPAVVLSIIVYFISLSQRPSFKIQLPIIYLSQ